MIEVKNVSKIYKHGDIEVSAVKNFSINILDGEFVSIVGKSGSGKSTLLHLLGGLDKPTCGTILIDGEDISKFTDKQMSNFRRENIGFVFQNFNLIPELTAKENIIFPMLLSKKKIDTEFLQWVLKLLDLEERLEHLPRQLSGGQQQRVAIARAFIMKPKYVFCDEPTGNLDSESGNVVMNMISELKRDLGMTILLVTHDREHASIANRLISIKDGIKVSENEPD